MAKVRLEFQEGSSSKFWEIAVKGSATHITFGKIGTTGQSQDKDHGSAAAARSFADKQAAAKRKKGYKDAKGGGAAAAAAGAGKRAGAAAGGAPAKKARKAGNALGLPEIDGPPKVFELATGSLGYGIFVDKTRCLMGNEEGLVADVDRKSGKPTKTYRLPAGVKCIVGDGDFLYVGTNDGAVFDLTTGQPRCVAQIEGFGELYWIDIFQGLIAASDSTGNVGLLNCEGEVVWKKTDDGNAGWMCRMDATGIYHGASGGVKKYDKKGKLLWECDKVTEVMFGVQTKDHVWPVGGAGDDCDDDDDDDDFGCTGDNKVLRINKKTGKVESEIFVNGGSSCCVSPDANIVYDANMSAQPAGRKGAVKWREAAWRELAGSGANYMSQQAHGEQVFCVGESFVCYDVSQKALKAAAAGKAPEPKQAEWGDAQRSQEVGVEESVAEVTSAPAGKVIVRCVKEGGKVRARVESKGYNAGFNCQFPRSIREDGARFVVDKIELAPSGDFYRVKGEIKRLRA